MIVNSKKFYSGTVLLLAFTIVLIIMFLPIFNGQNGLSYLDSLYNSISKGSAYYIPKLKKESKKRSSLPIQVSLPMADERQAMESQALFSRGGARVDLAGTMLNINGDLGAIMANCLEDADYMFENQGKKISQKYGYLERRVLYNWWVALTAMDKALKKQKMFSEAKFITTVLKKAVECAYNYYRIDTQNISDKYGLVLLSLAFYVFYTLWYGFAIMNLFEGLGFRLEH
jgi:hypothetical protein